MRQHHVALLAEGVDRNKQWREGKDRTGQSPSSRRAWIEIRQGASKQNPVGVALLAEGVDRNQNIGLIFVEKHVALLAEGVDRNFVT